MSRKRDAIVADYNSGDFSLEEIGEKHGIKRYTLIEHIRNARNAGMTIRTEGDHLIQKARTPRTEEIEKPVPQNVKQDVYINLSQSGRTTREIADELGKDPHTVTGHLRKARKDGAEIEKGRRITQTDYLKIVALRKEKLSYAQISKKTGLSEKAIRKRLEMAREAGVDLDKGALRAPKRVIEKPVKIKPIEKVVISYNAGQSVDDIARKLGMSTGTVTRYIYDARMKENMFIRAKDISDSIIDMPRLALDIAGNHLDLNADRRMKTAKENFDNILALKDAQPDLSWQAVIQQAAPNPKNDKMLEVLFRAAALNYITQTDAITGSRGDLTLDSCKLLQQKLG
ncbi:MAG TPA: hypothetical protein VGF14_05590 [Alphaproteobacteria bacterium]